MKTHEQLELPTSVKKFLLMLLAINLLGIAVFYYYSLGEYRNVGFHEGWPLYWYYPSGAAIVVSLSMFFAALLSFAWSARPTVFRLKIAVLVAISLLLLSLLTARLLYLGFEPSKVLLMLPSKTDSYVLQLAAAKSLVQGQNPYEQDYRSILLKELEPTKYTWIYPSNASLYTPERIVGFVHRFDYLVPAALWYVPAVLLKIPGNLFDALAIAVALTLVYRRTKRPFKAAFLAIISSSMFVYLSQSVLQDPVAGWLAPLMLAMAYPNIPLLSGILLGWAVGYRLYVAVFAVFYLIAAYKEGYNVKKMLISAITSEALLNLPFFLLDPKSFLEAVMLPITSNFRPLDAGPGLVSLAFFGFMLPKIVYSLLVATISVIGILIALKYYPRLKQVIFAFPTLALFCYYRPSPSYYMYYPFLALLGYSSGFFKLQESQKDVNVIEAWLANLSAYGIVLSLFSILLMFKLLSEFPVARIGVAVEILAAPGIVYFIKSRKQLGSLGLLTLLTLLLGIHALIVQHYLQRTYLVVMGHNFKNDALMLSIFGVQDLIHGKNPYFENHLQDMLSRKDFGDLLKIIPYCKSPINLSNYSPVKALTPYIDPNGSYMFAEQRVSFVEFYDYPPGLLLIFLPDALLGLPMAYWLTLLYAIALLLLFVKLWKLGLPVALAAALMAYTGYFLVILGFAFAQNTTPYVATILLALAFLERPKLFGALMGLAAATMFQAMLLALYIVPLIYFELGEKHLRKAAMFAIATFAITVLPFLYPRPLEALKRMYFPIFATLPASGISVTAILENFVFHSTWPVKAFRLLPYLVLTITWLIYWRYYERLKELGLLMPMLVIMFFHRALTYYLVYYPMIAFFVWLILLDKV
jgi:uncharacterized membrane protein